MAYQLLPGTKLKNDRYQIIKIALWRTTGGTYEAWDISITDKRYIIKEVIPPRMSAAELGQRTRRFNENLGDVMNLEHPNLAKLYDFFEENNRFYAVVEYIDGIPLNVFLQVIEKLPEKQVLGIGLKLCDALAFLWNRPRPVSFENLDFEHIMVDYGKNIKFMGYDLSLFFYSDLSINKQEVGPEVMERSIHNLSKILFFLLGGGKEITKERVPGNMNISDEFRHLLYVSLNPNQKSYSHIKDFRKALDKILNPEKNEDKVISEVEKRKRFAEGIPSLNHFKEIPTRIFRLFWGQKLWLKILEIITIIFVMAFFLILGKTESPAYKRPPGTPILYVATQSDLMTFRGDNYKLIDIRKLGNKLTSIYPFVKDGKRLLLIADSTKKSIMLLDPSNNEILENIRVDKKPWKITGNMSDKIIFVFHREGYNVTIIDMESFHIKGFLPTGIDAADICYSSSDKILFVSNQFPRDIIWFDPFKNKVIKSRKIAGQPGVLTLSPDDKSLYVHDNLTGNILAFDISKDIKALGPLKKLEGENPTSFLWDVVPGRLWITFEGTENLVLYDLEQQKTIKNFYVGKDPRKVIWDNNRKKLLLISAGSRELVIINPETEEIEREIEFFKTPEALGISSE